MELAITALGMITSVGRDVRTACAAMRAGITRPAEIPYYAVVDDEEEFEAGLLLGHPVEGVTDGFHHVGRWARLVDAALNDLTANGNLPARATRSFWARTAIIVVAPVLDEDRFQDPMLANAQQLLQNVAVRMLDAIDFGAPRLVGDVYSGHAGTAAALVRAAKLLEASELERVIVVAVDSYLDPTTLEWLSERNRLKMADNPAALMPGESAAAVLVEKPIAATQRGATVRAIVRGAATAVEERSYLDDGGGVGIALTQAIYEACNGTPPFDATVIADLNGETWRAREFGFSCARGAPRMDGSALVLPATSLGDTGAASGAVGVCVAVQAFERGYAGEGDTLVLSSSEYGTVGAIRIARNEQR